MRIDKTSRRVGFHKLAIPKSTLGKGSPMIGGQIPKALGPIKVPKLPKVKMPNYGGFPRGHVY